MLREYIAVIWPTGYKYRNEIVHQYRTNPRVNCVSTFYEKEFPSGEAFKEFIFDIYKNDDLSRDILEYKTGLMMKNDHFICSVFTFSIESDVCETDLDESVLDMKTVLDKYEITAFR